MRTIICNRPGCGGCPTVDFEDDVVIITDDFGGKAKMSINQWDVIRDKICAGEL